MASALGVATDLARISATLIAARRMSAILPEFPGELPATLDEAYQVQDLSRMTWADEVGGWKIGGVPEAYRDRFGVQRLVGPIFKRTIVHAKSLDTIEMPVFGGFAAVEAELVFKLGETPDQDRLHIGVEIASSPLRAINDIGPAAIISDFGNNGGLIVGPEIEGWRDRDIGPLEVQTEIGGEVRGATTITDFPKDGLAATAFLRAHAASRGIALPPGTYASSGAITGVHETQAGASATTRFGDLGVLHINLVSALPDGN